MLFNSVISELRAELKYETHVVNWEMQRQSYSRHFVPWSYVAADRAPLKLAGTNNTWWVSLWVLLYLV